MQSASRSRPISLFVSFVAFLLSAPSSPLTAQIQDNSFLIEEAYNQEAGVVQHINNFSRSSTGDWTYSFTQEWPLGGIHHQLSYTLPFLHLTDAGTRLGDIGLNYRYQLVGTPEGHTLVAPRFSLLLPTGSAHARRGTGGLGLQVNLPLTWVLSSAFSTHWNAGATLVPAAQDDVASATTFSQNLGASLIWLVRPSFNFLVESVWLNQQSLSGDGNTVRDQSVLVNPGIRGAINLAGGVQVVPGVAYTFNLSDGGEDAIFLYLSVEHPFKRQ
jgi:hypothetical protein